MRTSTTTDRTPPSWDEQLARIDRALAETQAIGDEMRRVMRESLRPPSDRLFTAAVIVLGTLASIAACLLGFVVTGQLLGIFGPPH